MNTQSITVKRALISVSDKTGLVEFATALHGMGIDIISTGGTSKALQAAGIPVIPVSEVTGFPEIMQGRVKTLHPLIQGGILGRRDRHLEEAHAQQIQWIDLVVCNLYPFAETIKDPSVDELTAIENIDIGGPTMIRAAAKNFEWVGSIVDPNDYDLVLRELTQQQALSHDTRRKFSAKAFAHTAQYDALIAEYFATDMFPETLTLTFKKQDELRYGENPHQAASVYRQVNPQTPGILESQQLQGKALSYNNIADAESALTSVVDFPKPACVVVKHANPCGVATDQDITVAFEKAYQADPKSAFGGIIALNRICNVAIAEKIAEVFAEVVIAPGFDQEALAVLAKKSKLRLLSLPSMQGFESGFTGKFLRDGLLLQTIDDKVITTADLKVVTRTQLNEEALEDVLFAWQVIKSVKSNAIVIARDQVTMGIGPGQVSRVDAVELALRKAGSQLEDAVLASDAFFPFRDSIDQIAHTGIRSIIQPGGSIRDEEVIAACNEYGIAMVFTGFRCFNH